MEADEPNTDKLWRTGWLGDDNLDVTHFANIFLYPRNGIWRHIVFVLSVYVPVAVAKKPQKTTFKTFVITFEL